MKKLKYIAYSALLVLFVLSTSACSPKTIVYKEVKIPVKCDVPSRERPQLNVTLLEENSMESLVYMLEVAFPAVFQYLEGIERDLAYCKGETK